ncbi:helix-turn-helix transcriptional regulator [Pseudorhodoferax soli]|uniref:helix-turn-helix transcriptional regulator n=1 Tax=Pseudorhodoferax soli TaxID=545864 RepID=UPI000DF308AC|nr:AlpA family phage regulatory protein [Pseudorhodoferax soli]
MLSSPSSAASLPESGYVRQAKLLQLVPFSKSTLWRRVTDRTFPPPVKLSPGVTAWRIEDVRRWMAQVDIPLESANAAQAVVGNQATKSAACAGPGVGGLASSPRRLFRSGRPA